MTNVILLLLLVVTSLIFSAFFSGMEIAYISSNKLKIELDNKKGEWSAKIVSFFSKSPNYMITAIDSLGCSDSVVIAISRTHNSKGLSIAQDPTYNIDNLSLVTYLCNRNTYKVIQVIKTDLEP